MKILHLKKPIGIFSVRDLSIVEVLTFFYQGLVGVAKNEWRLAAITCQKHAELIVSEVIFIIHWTNELSWALRIFVSRESQSAIGPIIISRNYGIWVIRFRAIVHFFLDANHITRLHSSWQHTLLIFIHSCAFIRAEIPHVISIQVYWKSLHADIIINKNWLTRIVSQKEWAWVLYASSNL